MAENLSHEKSIQLVGMMPCHSNCRLLELYWTTDAELEAIFPHFAFKPSKEPAENIRPRNKPSVFAYELIRHFLINDDDLDKYFQRVSTMRKYILTKNAKVFTKRHVMQIAKEKITCESVEVSATGNRFHSFVLLGLRRSYIKLFGASLVLGTFYFFLMIPAMTRSRSGLDLQGSRRSKKAVGGAQRGSSSLQ